MRAIIACMRDMPTITSAPRSRLLVVALSALALLVLAACGRTSPATGPISTVAIDELPAGLGRGYPVAGTAGLDNAGTGVAPGQMAPNFTLTLEDGRTLTMESLRGRPVLINHWATWCGPCRVEMPEIVEAAKAHPDLVVLAVNMMEARSQIEPFAAEFGLEIPVVVDPDAKVRDLYAVRGLPTSIVVDREGRISSVWAGVLTATKLEELLAPVVG
jgi:peroxiredoxin